MAHIVIIGNGISGTTCARHIRKQDSDVRITVISAETKYFFARTALMYIYMGHMKYEHTKPYEDHFWEKNRISLIHKYVSKVSCKEKQLIFEDTTTLSYDKLVIASGSKSNFFDWPGQELKGVQGLYSFQDLQEMENNTSGIQKAVIVGGGLIGVEMAEMLRTRNIEVTFLVREKHFWGSVLSKEEGDMIARHMKEHHIDLRLETELKEIKGENGKVKSVITKSGETIPCQFVGIATGVTPNIAFLKESDIKTDKGVLVNEYFETNTSDVYAIGDCAEFITEIPGRKKLEQVWYTGRMHGQVLAQTLCGNKTAYNPGPWFNSAKFFDIEFMNYGVLPAEEQDGLSMFYWEHPGGKIAMRIGYDSQTTAIKAINTFGIRLKHEILDSWIAEERNLDKVMQHLADANFDPELYKKHEPAIVTAYNQQFNKSITPEKRNWKRILQTIKSLPYA